MAVDTQEVTTAEVSSNGHELKVVRLADSTKHTVSAIFPDELYKTLTADAENRVLGDGSKGVTLGSVVLAIVADHYNFEIADNYGGRKRSVGLTKEQQRALAKSKRDAQREMLKSISAAMLEGKLTPAMLAQYGVKVPGA